MAKWVRTSGTYCSRGPRCETASSTRTRCAFTENIACGFQPLYNTICHDMHAVLVRWLTSTIGNARQTSSVLQPKLTRPRCTHGRQAQLQRASAKAAPDSKPETGHSAAHTCSQAATREDSTTSSRNTACASVRCRWWSCCRGLCRRAAPFTRARTSASCGGSRIQGLLTRSCSDTSCCCFPSRFPIYPSLQWLRTPTKVGVIGVCGHDWCELAEWGQTRPG